MFRLKNTSAVDVKPLVIVVASKSALKLNAVKAAFKDADVQGVATRSEISEQPYGDETLLGAQNRLRHARQLMPTADMYIAIENGIYFEDDVYFDKAVVLIGDKHGFEHLEYSDAVEFPKDAVEEAQRRGFAKVTVGEVLLETGKVKQKDDPHADLGSKISRVTLLSEALAKAMQAINAIKFQM